LGSDHTAHSSLLANARPIADRATRGEHESGVAVGRIIVAIYGGAALERVLCTSSFLAELGYMAKLKPEFEKRNCKIIGLSVDPVVDHARWSKDIEETQGHAPNYPMIGDPDLAVAKLYDMLPASTSGGAKGRTPADNATVRSVFVIGPDKKIKLILTYPMSTGRNFDEVLRVLDSIQLTAKHKVATPVNWKQGEDVIIVPAVSEEEAKQKFPQGWKAPKPYMRIVSQPK
jgi:alkyl hydroperoxide reductase subunit AhpC